jgi:hypothetical protein
VIPQHALPIQTILSYGMPGREPSNRFLARVAAEEEAPFCPLESTTVDLRHELSVLQGGFESTDRSLPALIPVQYVMTGTHVFLRGVLTALENASFADGNLTPRSALPKQVEQQVASAPIAR